MTSEDIKHQFIIIVVGRITLTCHYRVPGEIKSREVELGCEVGLLSLRVVPHSGATDIVFVTLPLIINETLKRLSG